MYFPRFGVWLYEMPFDKSNDGFDNIHATGRMVLLEDDSSSNDKLTHTMWVIEYEDNAYDVPTYGYEDENGYIVPLTEQEFECDLEYIDNTKEWIYQNELRISFDAEDIVAYGEGFWEINKESDGKYYERRQ